MKSLRVRALGLVAVVALGLGLAPAIAAADGLAVGDRAAEFDRAKLESGKAFQLKTHKGKWLFVTFGASWCKPCKAELLAWDKLAAGYKGKLVFAAVSVDNDIKNGKKFFAKLKLRNLTRVFLPQETSAADDFYETGTFPSTFIIDPNGIIRHLHKGYQKGDDAKMRQTLDALLK